jgi:hypothetical protein
VSSRRLARFDLRPERDAGTNDAMALHLRLVAGIVAGIYLSNMRRVWTFALKRIVAEFEIIIAVFVCT